MRCEVVLPVLLEETRAWARAVPEVLRLAPDLREAVMSAPRIRYPEVPELMVIHRCANCMVDTHLDDQLVICPVCGTSWPLDQAGMVEMHGGRLYQDWSPHPHPISEPGDQVDGIRAGVEWEAERRERIIDGVLKRLEADA